MRRKHKKIISLLAAGSMLLSVAGGTPVPAGAAEAVAQTAGADSAVQVAAAEAAAEITASESGTFVDAESGYSYTLYEVSDGDASVQKAEITGYTGDKTELVIPAEIGAYEVGRIGNAAFKQNKQITKVVIPEGVTGIGYEAFASCTKLTEAQIPSTIKSWTEGDEAGVGYNYNNNAFKSCARLTKLTLAEGLTILGQASFQDCYYLESVTIPSTIDTFYNETFSGCAKLKNLVLQEGIRQIGRQAFSGCKALEEVTIPASVTSWGGLRGSGMGERPDCCPFLNCTSLKKVTFTEGLKTLKNFNGFSGCTQLTEIEVPASLEETEAAFTGSSSLRAVKLQEGLNNIGRNMFSGCSALTDIVIPGSVVSIGFGAFGYCSSLEKLVFPPSVVLFDGGITSGCTNLKEVSVLAESIGSYIPSFSLPENAKLYCAAGSNTYEAFFRNLSLTEQSKLVALPDAGVEAEGCTAGYDGSGHDAVKLSGVREGDEVSYRINSFGSQENQAYQKEAPKMTEAGTYTVDVFVWRLSDGELPKVSHRRVTAEVRQKKQYTIHLRDVQVLQGQEYTITAEGYEGKEPIVYHYYLDEALQQKCDAKPTAAGVYYVQATVAETENDAAVQSNVAKITISEKDVHGPTMQPTASPTVRPTVSPVPNGVNRLPLKTVKSKKKKTLTVTWKKVSLASGYQVQIALNKKFSKGKKTCLVKKGSATKKTIKKLKRKKRYYVRVRAYRMYRGKKKYGDWSKVKSAKVK